MCLLAASARLAAFALLCLLTACGAGLIAVAGSTGGNSGGSAAQMTLADLPLVPGTGPGAATKSVVITNAAIRAGAALRVVIQAIVNGQTKTDEQLAPRITSQQGASTVIDFEVQTSAIFEVAEALNVDIPATLDVFADGGMVAPTIGVTLFRQPSAQLVQRGAREQEWHPVAQQLLSPLGGEVPNFRIMNGRGRAASEFDVWVTTLDTSGRAQGNARSCTGITVLDAGTDYVVISATVPGNPFPAQVSFTIDDDKSGASTAMENAHFRPDIAVALPPRGSTTGGSRVSLIGTALVPLDFDQQPPRPMFERVEILFSKGGREVVLDPQDLLVAESSAERLVFPMPTSPDGRAGEVSIRLSCELGAVRAEVTKSDAFLYANPRPVFGPRGAVLDRAPVAMAPIVVEGAGRSDQAPDLAILAAEGGVPLVQLLAAEENGMFVRLGPPLRLGDPAVLAERDPRDLAVADFTGDGVEGIAVANAGSGGVAHHLVVRGQEPPGPPLGAVNRLLGEGGTAHVRVADFNNDGLSDLLLVPGRGAPTERATQVQLRLPGPELAFGAPISVPVRLGPWDAVDVGLLDDDDARDVAVVLGGVTPRIDIAYGDGAGGFAFHQQLNLQIPNYLPHADSAAIGVHACGPPRGSDLAVVMQGLPSGGPGATTPPTVALLRQEQNRTFVQPVSGGGSLGSPTTPISASLAADLSGDGIAELVVAARDTSLPATSPLAILLWNSGELSLIENGVELSAEQLYSVQGLRFGTAFPAVPSEGRPAVAGVFVVHESLVDGARERRVSTFLVNRAAFGGSNAVLAAPDAGGTLETALALVGGNYTARSANRPDRVRDLALASILATGPQVRLVENDGFGGFFAPTQRCVEPLLLPETVFRVPAGGGRDLIGFCTSDGKLGLWLPQDTNPPSTQGATWLTGDLRQLAPNPALHGMKLATTTRVRSGDVDGDGFVDLVALLRFQVITPGPTDAVLIVMRGGATGSFPFHVPSAADATAVHGTARSFALGDFAPTVTGQPRRLEVALAVPVNSFGTFDGNHVRFYRYVDGGAPATGRLVPSSDVGGAPILVAGNGPTQVATGDFDTNGTDDLVVASVGDASIRLILNSGLLAEDPLEVRVESFEESLGASLPLPTGDVTFLHLGDINGDGNIDALLSSQGTTSSGQSTTSVAFYLGSGTGELVGPERVSPTRLGDRDAGLVVDLGDFNGDSVPDLVAGWSTSGALDRNVRVLFGGSL